MISKREQLVNSLLDRGLAISTIACEDTVSVKSLQEKNYFFWMVGPELKAGSIVAVYIPKCEKSKFHNFPSQERGKINYLFLCARRTFRPASKKFATSQSRNIVFLYNRIRLNNGITLNQLNNSALKYYSKNIWRLGRLSTAPNRAEINEFWNLVLDNNPNAIDVIESELLEAPKFLKLYQPKNLESYKYQIAISCASEDSHFVDDLYKACKTAGIITYYYRSQLLDENIQKESNLPEKGGIDIYKEIEHVYQKEAYFFVPIISENYKKSWTERELALYQERFVSSYEYMIPIRLDDAKIPGLEGNIKYYYPNRIGIGGIVNKIKEKLDRVKSKET